MTNNQTPVTNAALRAPSIGYWLLVIGYSLLLSGCGGADNNAPAAPEAASLEGDRRSGPVEDWKPAVDVSNAPTKVHGALASLVPNPKKALVANSLKYGNWIADTASYELESPESATLPVVMADYFSSGFEIEKDPETGARVEISYPQRCKLFIVRAPDAAAAPVIADKIVVTLESKNFGEISSLEDAAGRASVRSIRRFSAIVPQDGHDDVYVAYLLVVGDTVIYAVESETAEKIELDDGSQLSRVDEGGGRGSRVGAMLISLITWAIDNT